MSLFPTFLEKLIKSTINALKPILIQQYFAQLSISIYTAEHSKISYKYYDISP